MELRAVIERLAADVNKALDTETGRGIVSQTGYDGASTDPEWEGDKTAQQVLLSGFEKTGLPAYIFHEGGEAHVNCAAGKEEYLVIADELEGSRLHRDRVCAFATSISIRLPEKVAGTSVKDVITSAVAIQDLDGRSVYSADSNKAYKNRKAIECTDKRLENCRIAIGNYDSGNSLAHMTPLILLYEKLGLDVERETGLGTGATAIDLCYCADPAKGMAAYVDFRGEASRLFQGGTGTDHGVRSYDILAPLHILEKAGGIVTDIKGEKIKLEERKAIMSLVAASNPAIHKRIINALSGSLEKSRRIIQGLD